MSNRLNLMSLLNGIESELFGHNSSIFCSLHPTPEGQNFYSVPVQGQNLKMITNG